MSFKTTYMLQFVKPVGILKRDLNAVTKLALQDCAKLWDTEFKPKHFTAAGAQEYGYRRRHWLTDWLKKKLGQGNTPLVATGKLRDAMMRWSPQPQATSARGGDKVAQIRLVYKGLPRYIHMIGGERGALKVQELHTISEAEGLRMAHMVADKVVDHYQRNREVENWGSAMGYSKSEMAGMRSFGRSILKSRNG